MERSYGRHAQQACVRQPKRAQHDWIDDVDQVWGELLDAAPYEAAWHVDAQFRVERHTRAADPDNFSAGIF